ncbi:MULTISPECIES: ribosomal protein S18-alanine N-acetyltransferase [Bacillaceae]|uniref:ribosomal protein S18-alanine N-acetyltransferase n=1 Tax=Bacillaceae TaxID=186817 RepID=UPI001E288C68|nr:ribosomal protein S18-alanine N-acetyltransferase [Bacillus sp. FJAT-27916]
MMTNHTVMFRAMTLEDLDDVMEVEHASFTLPWSREAFYNELVNNQYAVYLVVEDRGRVIGYGGQWVILDEGHITNIALLPAYRGYGLGEELMIRMMGTAKSMGVKRMTLEVRVTNHGAQKLYRKMGFQEGGIRKNYYTDNMEDALVMWVELW